MNSLLGWFIGLMVIFQCLLALGLGVLIRFIILDFKKHRAVWIQDMLRELQEADALLFKKHSDLETRTQQLEYAQHLWREERDQQDKRHLAYTRSGSGAYKQAIKLVEMGGELNDIVSTCQLNHAEASLLLHLREYRVRKRLEKSG